eukprot:CAMPEP_0184479454 /NCGR_PEP_ID=MMETSP0113_2-20130426/1175_1 /TAXON_ID=91329 /ORGANISM="Norrisiella sphaerica, Strain BC52" /LENGTH=44 /DNA_ID= /DNA_START= /DNA_END= /DNA_ORIENTATION=
MKIPEMREVIVKHLKEGEQRKQERARRNQQRSSKGDANEKMEED